MLVEESKIRISHCALASAVCQEPLSPHAEQIDAFRKQCAESTLASQNNADLPQLNPSKISIPNYVCGHTDVIFIYLFWILIPC